jgi:hypothetical protein
METSSAYNTHPHLTAHFISFAQYSTLNIYVITELKKSTDIGHHILKFIQRQWGPNSRFHSLGPTETGVILLKSLLFSGSVKTVMNPGIPLRCWEILE